MEALWSDELPKELEGEVEAWVRNWNKQFEAAEEDVPEKYMSKAVATTDTALRRLLLEVLQYLTTSETETLVAFACKEWFHVSRDEEFWKGRFISEFTPLETEAQGDYRKKYIAFTRASCWHCKKLQNIKAIYRMSPYFNRPICYACNHLPNCQIESFNSFMKRCKVTQATLDSLQVPSFSYPNTIKSSYILFYQAKLLPYAEARRKLLLSTLESDYPNSLRAEDKEVIAKCNLQAFYGAAGVRCWMKGQAAVLKFCGRWGKRENLRKSVEEFLEQFDKSVE
jgi:hypothetical protein